MRELDHVMSATKPKTKDADIKQTKEPHWPRLGVGTVVFMELVHCSNRFGALFHNPEKQIRSFCKFEKGSHLHATTEHIELLFSRGLVLGERLTPSPGHPCQWASKLLKMNRPVSPWKAARKAQWLDFPFELWGQGGPPESSLFKLSQSASDWKRSWKQLLENGSACKEVPACLPSALPLLTPPGHTRMRCQVKYKQSTDWIIIYSVLNLN